MANLILANVAFADGLLIICYRGKSVFSSSARNLNCIEAEAQGAELREANFKTSACSFNSADDTF